MTIRDSGQTVKLLPSTMDRLRLYKFFLGRNATYDEALNAIMDEILQAGENDIEAAQRLAQERKPAEATNGD